MGSLAKKSCAICKVKKNPDQFNRCDTRNDGLFPYCKPCRSLKSRERLDIGYDLIKEAFEGEPCLKCGEVDWVVIDLHHVDPSKKEFGLSTNGAKMKLKSIKNELKKVIPLCANCHRKFHKKHKSWQDIFKFITEEPMSISTPTPKLHTDNKYQKVILSDSVKTETCP